MTTTIARLKEVDFDRIEKDVVSRIRMLAACVKSTPDNDTGDAMARDLYRPVFGLLAHFCECCTFEDVDG